RIINDKLNANRKQHITSPEKHFRATPAVNYLKQQQKTDRFRIFAIDNSDANWYMYHQIESIFGYNAAKLRIYQDMLGKNMQYNPNILRMLNTRYIISKKQSLPGYTLVPGFETQPEKVFESADVLPRAFFVEKNTVIKGGTDYEKSKIAYEKHRDMVLGYLGSSAFDPAKTAVLEEEAPFEIQANPANSVELSGYDIHRIQLHATVAAPAQLVLSEIYYPAGWKAFVDGEETGIYKTNYLLRSIFLQPGDHQIEFIFDPASFRIGKGISLSLLGLLLLIIGSTVWVQKKRAEII
ncbi:YfhO family protein, partial [bacterium]|nr:YfhO family protein [bacterium]